MAYEMGDVSTATPYRVTIRKSQGYDLENF